MAPLLLPRLCCECEDLVLIETRRLIQPVWGVPHFQEEFRCGVCHTLLEREALQPLPWVPLPPSPLLDLPVPKKPSPPPQPRRIFPVSEWSVVGHNCELRFAMVSGRSLTSHERVERARERARICELHRVYCCPAEECRWQISFALDEISAAENIAANRHYGVPRKPRTAVFAGVTCPRVGKGWWIYRRKQGESIVAWRNRLHEIRRAVNLAQRLKREVFWDDLANESPISWTEKYSASLYNQLYGNCHINNVSLNCQDEFGNLCLGGKAPSKLRSQFKVKMCGPRPNRGFNAIEACLAKKLRLAFYQDEWREAKLLRREKMSRAILRDSKIHRIKFLRSELENLFLNHLSSNPFCLQDEMPVGEMEKEQETPHGVSSDPKSEQKSNVVLENQEGESQANPLPAPKKSPEFRCLAAPVSKITERTFTDRWVTIKSGKWTKENINDELFALNLPKDVLNNKDFRRSPNFAPFRQHTYWRGNMRVKILVNANQRQYGQLQVRFYYMAYCDENFDLRRNIYTGSQQPHCLITANCSNSGELFIPFEYIYPVLCIAKGPETWDVVPEDEYANIGTLICSVLVPLTVAETTPQNVTYSVLIAFEDSEFAGMVDTSIMLNVDPDGEMFSLASMFAMSEIAQALDPNRDNPTVHAVCNPIIPVNTGSWCMGNGIPEWSNALRLNPLGTTPYPESRVPEIDEMKIDFIKKIYGIIAMLDWTAQDNQGNLIYSMDAEPLLQLQRYPILNYKENQVFCVPPVGVLSSMFAWWRGSLKLRIDVVGATELTGRLLVCYVPRYYKSISMSQAVNCAHSIFDLQQNRQFNFEIPFMSDKLFWERNRQLKSEFETVQSPGMIHIFIYNQLIPNATIPASAKLILYLAGGDDFEVSVPAFPIVAPGFNPKIELPEDSEKKISVRLGYSPCYAGTWRGLSSGLVLRYGAVTDHVAQFDVDGQYVDILYKPLKLDSKKVIKASEADNVKQYYAEYLVAVQDNSGYIYALVFPDKQTCIEWFNLCKDKIIDLKYTEGNVLGHNCLIQWQSVYKGITEFAEGDYWTPANVYAVLDAPTAQMALDERKNQETKSSRPQPTACGRALAAPQVFGERFTDLKDFCRRYQMYTSLIAPVVWAKQGSKRVIMFKFPAAPQGLDLKTRGADVIDYWNRTRGGPIPLILSAYRFFVGGLRYRIAVNLNTMRVAFPDPTAKIFIQHRPDINSNRLVSTSRTDHEVGTDDLELPGYASYFQFDNINNIISVSVPYYLPTSRILLQRPADTTITKWSSLGELAIGFSMSNDANAFIDTEVYYSFDDDARACVFQGFPPMIDITKIPPRIVNKPKLSSASSFEALDLPQGEMGLGDYIPFYNTSKALDNVAKLDVDKVNDTIENTNTVLKSIQETITNSVPTFSSLKDKVGKYTSTIINLITNLVHVIVNLNIRSIVTAIISIFAQLKLVTVDFTSKMISLLYSIFTKASSGEHNVEEGVEIPVGQMDEIVDLEKLKKDDDHCTAAYVSTLIAGVAAALALTPRITGSNWKSICLLFYDSLKNFSLTANCLYTFIKNNLLGIQRIGQWLIDDSPTIKDIQFLNREKDIYQWALDVQKLTNPWLEQELFSDMEKASRVHLLAAKGQLIMLNLAKMPINPQQFRVLEKLLENITKLRDRLTRAHRAPPARFVPFVYELTGPTGIGKSHLLNIIPQELLKHARIQVNGEVIYHRALGNPWWNNCNNQPVCSIDEKFPVSGPQFADVQIAELFQLVSRCIFNPPMPDLPDKNLRYNPLIVQYASNNPFPQLSSVLDPTAVNRRRNCLIQMAWEKGLHDKYIAMGVNPTVDKLTYEERRDFKFALFRFSNDVMKEQCTWSPWLTYAKFLERLKLEWYNYYLKEHSNYMKFMQMAVGTKAEDGEDFEAFDAKWDQMVKTLANDNEISGFKEDLDEVFKLQKQLKDIKDKQNFGTKIFRVINKHFGLNKSKDEISEEELVNKIKKLHFKMECTAYGELEKQEMPVGQMMEVFHEQLEGFAEVITRCSEKRNRCPHDLLFDYKYFPCASTVNFNRSTKRWEIDYDIFGGLIPQSSEQRDIIQSVHPNSYSKKILTDYGKEIDVNEPEIMLLYKNTVHISNKTCAENCAWSKFEDRLVFYKWFHQHNKMIKDLYSSGATEKFSSHVPQEYVEYIVASFNYQEQTEKEISWIRGLYSRVKETLMSVPWKKWIQRVALLLGVFFFIGVLWKIWGFAVEPETLAQGVDEIALGTAGMKASYATAGILGTGIAAQSFASGDYKVGATKKNTPRGIAMRELGSMPFGQMNNQGYMNLCNSIKRNTFLLSMYSADGKCIVGRCLGICGKYALCVDHYWEAYQTFSRVHATQNMHIIPMSSVTPTALAFSLNEFKYQPFVNSSIGLLEVPARVPLFKDIRNLIAPLEAHKFTNCKGMVVEMDYNKELNACMGRECYVDYQLMPSIQVKGSELFSDFRTGKTYCYKGFHGFGRCGSVLTNTSINHPILGMHVAGTSEHGYAESIYREMFKDLTPNKAVSAEMSVGEGRDSHKYIDGQVWGIGAVTSKFSHRANDKSRIQASAVQRAEDSNFPVHTELSILSPKDPRFKERKIEPHSPMVTGCEHHGKPLLPFNSSDLNNAKEDLKNLILAKNKPVRSDPGLLAEIDVIRGIDGVWGMESLEWNSSEGFPFSSLRPPGSKDKRWLFDFDKQGQCIGVHKILRQSLDKKWETRLAGIVPETVFVDCLKDCTVSKEKVMEPGKTRIFSISPVDFTIQQRQCTLDFVNAFMFNRLDLEHAVGINPVSEEWTHLTNNILKFGNNIVTGDYSKFGDTIPTEFVLAFFEVVIDWYRVHGILLPEHEQQLKIMAFEISHSTHLMFDFLYKVICGQPSGNSLTVIINSFANSLYVRMAWLDIMRFTKTNSLEDLHRHVKWYSYGDDLILGVSDEIKDQFNAQSMSAFFARHNLKFTNADKGDKIVPYTNISEATFLKRGFRKHPKRRVPELILAPLEVKSIEDTVNWVTKDGPTTLPETQWFTDMSIQVCEDALRNAYCSGPEFYTEFKNKLTNFWQSKGIHFKAATWSELDFKIFDLGENICQYFKNVPYNIP